VEVKMMVEKAVEFARYLENKIDNRLALVVLGSFLNLVEGLDVNRLVELGIKRGIVKESDRDSVIIDIMWLTSVVVERNLSDSERLVDFK
jgi:hypothetical protein